MNAGTFLNRVNKDFRDYSVSKGICPYGYAYSDDGQELSNLHLAWMNASALEDQLIQHAAATQAVLEKMRDRQTQPTVGNACHWWGIRDADAVEKELLEQTQAQQRRREEEQREKERAMLPPPPVPPRPLPKGTNEKTNYQPPNSG